MLRQRLSRIVGERRHVRRRVPLLEEVERLADQLAEGHPLGRQRPLARILLEPRARLTTGADGRYSFWSVLPVDYPVPQDGTAIQMLQATTGRSWRRHHPVAWTLAGTTLALLALLMHWPALARPLGLATLPAAGWLMALGCCLACVGGVTPLTRRIFIMRA